MSDDECDVFDVCGWGGLQASLGAMEDAPSSDCDPAAAGFWRSPSLSPMTDCPTPEVDDEALAACPTPLVAPHSPSPDADPLPAVSVCQIVRFLVFKIKRMFSKPALVLALEDGAPCDDDGPIPEPLDSESVVEVLALIAPPSFPVSENANLFPQLVGDAAGPQDVYNTDLLDGARGIAACLDRETAANQVCEHNENVVRILVLEQSLTTTLKAEASRANAREYKIRSMRVELAMASMLADRMSILPFISNIIKCVSDSDDGSLISIIEVCRYDETPLRFTARADSLLSLDIAARNVKLPRLLGHVDTFEDAAITKLCHTLHGLSILIYVQNEYWSVEFSFPQWLQAMSSTRGECYYRCVQSGRLPLKGLSTCFHRRARIVTTDDDGAIHRCEAGIDTKGAPTRTHTMILKCEVHKAAGMRKKTMKLFTAHISFLVHVSLAIGMGSAMVIMRRELRNVLKESIEYRYGTPPPHHRDELQALLDVFWHSPERTVQLRRAIVEGLFTGGLDGPTIVHWCAGCCGDRKDCLAKFCVYGVQALCGSAPKPFSIHRWTRQELVVNWVGMFEGCNRLFSRTFSRFCVKVGSKLLRPPRDVPAAASWEQRAAAIQDQPDAGAAGVQVPGEPSAAAPNAGGPARTAWEEAQFQQSRSRSLVLGMCGSDAPGQGCLGDLITLAHVLEPQRRLMASLLYLGGATSQECEDEKAAVAQMRDERFGNYQYRGLVAATCELENHVTEDVARRMPSPMVWNALPAHSRTQRLRTKAFQTLAMCLCLAEEMRALHKGYPFKLFRLLLTPDDASLVTEIEGDSHLWCPWSEAFIETWQVDGLTCDHALMDLRVSVLTATFDTSVLEAKHSAVRRVLLGRSNQTVPPSVDDISAMEVLRLYRKHAARVEKLLFPGSGGDLDGQTDAGAGPGEARGKTSGKRRGGGGAWRLFVADHPDVRDMSIMSDMYKNQTPEDLERLLERGLESTEQHRLGHAATRGSAREVGRAAKRQRRENEVSHRLLQQAVLDGPSTPAHQSVRALVPGKNGWERVMELKTRYATEGS
ncbi:MAG: hypothetical protein GWQ05_22925, partial [Verrucomicrobiaceae bacterium]|nr:hypothetical protein [Verrucomicrobiaceae bacterium]